MRVIFLDHEYRAVHGRRPRGRGAWIFEIQSVDGTLTGGRSIKGGDETLTEAKAVLRAKAAEEWPSAQLVVALVRP